MTEASTLDAGTGREAAEGGERPSGHSPTGEDRFAAPTSLKTARRGDDASTEREVSGTRYLAEPA